MRPPVRTRLPALGELSRDGRDDPARPGSGSGSERGPEIDPCGSKQPAKAPRERFRDILLTKNGSKKQAQPHRERFKDLLFAKNERRVRSNLKLAHIECSLRKKVKLILIERCLKCFLRHPHARSLRRLLRITFWGRRQWAQPSRMYHYVQHLGFWGSRSSESVILLHIHDRFSILVLQGGARGSQEGTRTQLDTRSCGSNVFR